MDIKKLDFKFRAIPETDQKDELEFRSELREQIYVVAELKMKEARLNAIIEAKAGELIKRKEEVEKQRKQEESVIQDVLLEMARHSDRWGTDTIKADVGDIKFSASAAKQEAKVNTGALLNNPDILDALKDLDFDGSPLVVPTVNPEVLFKLIARGDIDDETASLLTDLGLIEVVERRPRIGIRLPKS